MYPYDTEEEQDNPLRLKLDPAIAGLTGYAPPTETDDGPLRLKLDPEIMSFVASRGALKVPAGPDLDALVKAEEARDAKGYLGQVLDQAGAMIRREKTGPLPALPKMDDSIRQFVLSQKLGRGLGADGKPLNPLQEAQRRKTEGEAGKFAPATESDIQTSISLGIPEKVARNLRTVGDHDELRAKYGAPPKEHDPAALPDDDIQARGKAVGVIYQKGEKPEAYRNKVIEAEASKAGGAKKMSEAQQAAAIELRKEFNSLPEVKAFEEVTTAYRKIKTTSETGAGDISLIFGYMKMMDPGSTVREGEFATAANAGSIPQSVVAAYNRAVNGQKLDDNVRKMFKAEAERVYAAQEQQYRMAADEYEALAESQGIPKRHVVRPRGYTQAPTPAPAPSTASGLPPELDKYVPK